MRIAVSGIGVVSALGIGVDANLDALRKETSGIGPLTLFPSRHTVPVGEVKSDNASLKRLAGLSEEVQLSRTTLLGMLAAREALNDACIRRPLRIGLVSATSVGGMDLTEEFFPHFMEDPLSGNADVICQHDPMKSTRQIAAYCEAEHYATTISTACSSAANAMMFAARLLRHDLCDVVIAGGCDSLSKFTLNGFMSLAILDSAPCRPFDAGRQGLNLGEGAGYVVLQREKTLSRKAYAVLSGFANANDAFHQTASSPDGEGAFRAMSEALEMAGLHPEEVDYLNVHGTGTPNNDKAEATAMQRVWDGKLPSFSSTKCFTGHTLAAAGGIEAVYSVLALHRGLRFANLGFAHAVEGTDLIPCLHFEEEVPTRHVMSNSFGFGGNDSSVIFSKA